MPPAELVNFAAEFAENWSAYNPGTYLSKEGNYKLEYVEDGIFPDFGYRPTDVGRVSLDTGEIQLSKNRLRACICCGSPDFVFASIIWCWFSFTLSDKTYEEKDTALINYYKTTGRSIHDLVNFYTILCPTSALNKRRYENICNLLK